MECDRGANFKADIIEYGLREYDSGAAAVYIKCHLGEIWDAENREWADWAEYGMEAEGFLFIVKKDGTLNQTQIKSLCEATGWDGDFVKISTKEWTPRRCQVQTKAKEYEGTTTYPVSWINHIDRDPSAGLSNIDADKAKQLNAKYGGQVRALAGNATRNATPSTGKPPAPKANGTRKPAQAADDANAALQEAAAGRDDAPF